MRRNLKSVPDPGTVAVSSKPEVLDLAATERDVAADRRDTAAADRDALAESHSAPADLSEVERARADRLLAARDRAAAALDRQEAALDRFRAQKYLGRSYRDELTGALQRMSGRDQLAHAVARAHRTKEQLVVAFLDVDHLKRRNDQQGHAAGDELLRAVGSALENGLRSYDVVVRYGGDEFVCALPDSSLEHATARFDEVRRQLRSAVPDGSFSIGLVELTDDEPLDDVIARADRLMYMSRHRGDT